MPFSLATYIVNGAATLDAFRDQARSDAVTRALAKRITITEDPSLTAKLPGQRPARVRSAAEGRANARSDGTDEQGRYRGSIFGR